MNLINNIYKKRLTDELNIKTRYFYISNKEHRCAFKFIFNLDNVNYCLYNDKNKKFWFTYNKLHRDGDKPALIDFINNNYIKYFKNGIIHRDDNKPAVIDLKIGVFYYKNGKRHRDNDEFGNPQPAIEYIDGTKDYYKEGINLKINDFN